MKNINWKKILHIVLLISVSVLFIASIYLQREYADESIEELLFYLTTGATDTDFSVITSAFLSCIIPFIFCISILYVLFYEVPFLNRFKWYPITIVKEHKSFFTTVLCTFMLVIACINVNVFNFLKDSFTNSNFIKDNYVINNIEFPTQKRNLITIYVESLETTLFTKEQGGDWDYEVIPELYKLLHDEDAIYFSSDDKSAGMYNLYGTTWTTASLVSNSTGLPFKVPVRRNKYKSKNFMNGSYAIGDILKEQGYVNEVISAAKTDFGGIKEFYKKHGDYKIYDLKSFRKNGYDYKSKDESRWGVNDGFMFSVAKDRLTKLYSEGKTFNETIIGVDTHFRDGIKTHYTINKYKTQYENVYATESKMIYEFINWAREQEWYKDTTIVIIGDHISMQTQYFKKYNKTKRKRYNVILNSQVTTENTKNRVFTSVDMYPTILAAMGVKIENDQMGLGINLFSDRKTLSEQYGFGKMNMECSRKSDFYNSKILDSDYDELK